MCSSLSAQSTESSTSVDARTAASRSMKNTKILEVTGPAAQTQSFRPVPATQSDLAHKRRHLKRKSSHQKPSMPAAVAAPPMQEVARPDAQGRFGKFGGKYVPETLMAALTELEIEFHKALKDQAFQVSTIILEIIFPSAFCTHLLAPTLSFEPLKLRIAPELVVTIMEEQS